MLKQMEINKVTLQYSFLPNKQIAK